MATSSPMGLRHQERNADQPTLRREGLPAHLREGETAGSPDAALDAAHVRVSSHRPGLQPEVASAAEGHSSINLTLDTYAMWWTLEDHAAADALGALVGIEGGLTALQRQGCAGKYPTFLLRAHSSVG